jgi:hypothetical protein
MGGSEVTEGVPLKGFWNLVSSSLFLLPSATSGKPCSTMCTHKDVLPCNRPRCIEASQLWTETFEIVS